jgi:PAS domain S-box-containing protein
MGRDDLDILLIEDNPGDARLIGLMLDEIEEQRVRVTRADRLASGLAHLAEAARPPDAVLLDLSLPDSHGLETFTRLQAAAPTVPVVVLSGLADETIAVGAVSAGAQDYLVKGQVDGPLLVRAIRYAIERKRADEERLTLLTREQAARYRLVGQIADAVITADPQGRITFVNAAARRLLGDDGALAGDWRDADGLTIAPDDLPLVRAACRGEATVDAEWQLMRAGGATVIVQGSATPVRAVDGQHLGAVLTLHDVTARRALEHEREEFFANASHDLRTPLAAIKAAIGVVLANEPAGFPTPLHRMLANIDVAASEMARLVDDLLELGRLQRGRSSLAAIPCDLRAIAERATRAIEPLAAARGQQLTISAPERAVPVLADAARIERALLNLLGNAQKYGREGGRIDVQIAERAGEGCVAVADDGPGIPADDQARIFERFYRPRAATTRAIVGSGLGLPIVKTLVELHGGRVAVESAPGAGATFYIALPLATETRLPERPEGVTR